MLECGHIHAGDVLWVSNGGGVARVQCFWQAAETPAGDERAIVAQCKLCEHVAENVYTDTNVSSFIDAEDVVDAVSYRPLGDGMMRVIKPFVATLV